MHADPSFRKTDMAHLLARMNGFHVAFEFLRAAEDFAAFTAGWAWPFAALKARTALSGVDARVEKFLVSFAIGILKEYGRFEWPH